MLPGEVIFKCVTALQLGALQQDDLPQIDHLIVDEFQDLNACDQQFVSLLAAQGAVLFIAGDVAIRRSNASFGMARLLLQRPWNWFREQLLSPGGPLGDKKSSGDSVTNFVGIAIC